MDVASRVTRPFTMRATGPAARATLALFELFLCAANTTFSCDIALGVFDPTYELVTREWGDVIPRFERVQVRLKRSSKVVWQRVDDSPGYATTSHGHLP